MVDILDINALKLSLARSTGPEQFPTSADGAITNTCIVLWWRDMSSRVAGY